MSGGSSSRGHALAPLDREQVLDRARRDRRAGWWPVWQDEHGVIGGRLCSSVKCAGRCHAVALYEGSYLYTTGARGRTSTARKRLCLLHAQTWAAKHGLTLPEATFSEQDLREAWESAA